jgi:stress response protein YsnF
MTPESNRHTRLQKLKGSDFEMADGDPDIRGWDVKDSSGKQLGEVEELIFDTQSLKVRYLVVDLEENDFNLEDKEVLVPVGIAELHQKADDVILTGISPEQLRALPEFDEDRFDTDHETSVRNVFGGLGAAALSGKNDDDFYNHEHFNEANLYRNRSSELDMEEEKSLPIVSKEMQVGKKDVPTGGLRLRSRLVEKEVEQDINLRHEQVQVDRTQVDRPATNSDYREKNLEEHEIPVVSKEATVVEEISPRKDVSERDETISDTLRTTDVDMETKDKSYKDRMND